MVPLGISQNVNDNKVNRPLQLTKIYRIQAKLSYHLTDQSQLGVREDDHQCEVQQGK